MRRRTEKARLIRNHGRLTHLPQQTFMLNTLEHGEYFIEVFCCENRRLNRNVLTIISPLTKQTELVVVLKEGRAISQLSHSAFSSRKYLWLAITVTHFGPIT